MPTFSYIGCDAAGANESGTIDAATEKLAYDMLSARGIIVFELSNGTAIGTDFERPWYRRDLKFSSGQIPLGQQAVVADLMATLFDAKLSVPEVLSVAAQTSETKSIQRFFVRVKQSVDDGTSFAQAFKLENKQFSPIFESFLNVAERSNSFSELLAELSKLLKRQHSLSQKITAALIYPSILVCSALALILVVIFYMAPNLAPIFSALGREPPATLGRLLWLNEMFRTYWLFVLTGLIGVVLSLLVVRSQTAAQKFISQIKFQIPLLGKTFKLSSLTQLSLASGLLMRSGLSQAEALKESANSIKPASPFNALFEEAALAIEAGNSASRTFAQSPHLPQLFKELYRVGEESNRLQEMLNALSTEFAAQVERDTDRWLALITPTLTLVLGLGIGLLVHTLMGAVLEVNELAF